MIKKDLLGMKRLHVTEQMRKMVKEDIGEKVNTQYTWSRRKSYMKYKRYLYFRVAVQDSLLKVALFSRLGISEGKQEPEFEIYISMNEKAFLTYETATGRWLNAKIDMINYTKEDGYTSGNDPFTTKEDEKQINDFLGYTQKKTEAAVLEFQWMIRKEQLKKKHRRETDEIDEVMNTVPELPKDFSKWAEDFGLYRSRYIFYHAGRKVIEGYCSHCKQTVSVSNPKRNDSGTCPSCKSNIIFKPWKGQKNIVDDDEIAILQKLIGEDSYVLRIFRARKQYRLENEWKKPEFHYFEFERDILDSRFNLRNSFEYGEFKQSGVSRWCNYVNHGGYYDYNNHSRLVPYGNNIQSLRMEIPELKYMPLEDVILKTPGADMKITTILQNAFRKPKAEYLIKANLYNMARKVLEGNLDVNENAKKPWDFLKIKKEQFEMCIDINITAKEIGVLRMANKENLAITSNQIQWIAKHAEIDLVTCAKHTTIHKMIRYFKEELKAEKNGHALKDYWDYICMAEKNGLDIKQESVIFPQHFMQAHDEMARQIAEREEKKLRSKEVANDKKYKKVYKRLLDIYQYESKSYVIVIPASKAEFRKEGNANHNCVGGYFERVLKGRSVVVFLRKKSEPDVSFCTVELKEDSIVQCRTNYNGDAPKEVQGFLKKYTATVKAKLNEEKGKERKVS